MTNVIRLSLLLSALVATPALAQSQAPALTRVVVSAADLDLASAAGQRALDRRLAHAVVEACGVTSTVDLTGSNDIRRCRVEIGARIAADRDRLVELASRGSDIVLASR